VTVVSITYWNRLIPQPLETSLDSGLSAQMRDPVWTLARQFQMGEFLGADGGSPSYVDVGTRTTVFDRANRPLEPSAMGEPTTPDFSVRVELGQVLENLIDQMVGPAAQAASAKSLLRTRYPLPVTPDQSLSVFAGSVIDGAALQADLVLGRAPSLDPATDPSLKPVFSAFSAWVADVLGELGTTAPAQWNASTIDYSLSFPATLPDGRSVTLTAEPDRSMDLDWYSFDIAQANASGTAAPLVSTSVIPGHVRFRGMPNSRFWDFESSKTEFGNIIADVPDAGRLLFLDFMLIHGVGWFIVPLDVPVGSLCQIASLTLHDVFDGTIAIPWADAALGPAGVRSTFFSLSDRTTGGVAGALFTAPSCSSARQTSAPVEDVRLFRDDAAEVVWAVEETAPDASGYPTPGYERGTAQSPPRLPILRYQLQTPVPPAWFPFLPQESGGSLVDFVAATIAGGSNQPWGRIIPSLPASGSAGIPEQAIPRAGLRLQRTYCRTRWNDGTTYLWMARRRQLGSRGPASGLKYDLVQLGSS
jgi:hypothetical protein